MRKTKSAFCWLINLFRKNKVEFIVFGGFAATIYGSPRKLADIDVCIGERDLVKLFPGIQRYAKIKLKHYKDANWDTLLVTLVYAGQEIDICAIEKTNIFNKIEKKWEPLSNYLKRPQKVKYLGRTLKVVRKSKLIEYKNKLLRRVDKKDAKFLQTIEK